MVNTIIPPQEMKAQVMRITPEIARQWLDTIDKFQRPVSTPHVKYLANQITQGKWMFNGESIKISKENTVIDGQHRLQAIIEANTPLQALVVFNLDRNTYHTMDQGKKRSPGDVLAARGHKLYHLKSGIANFVLKYQRGKYYIAGSPKNTNPDIKDIIDWVETTPLTDEMALEAMNYHRTFKMIKPTMYGGLKYLYGQVDKSLAEEYMRKISTGLDIRGAKNPFFLLRQRFIKDYHSKEALPTAEKIALMNKVWNYTRAGQTEIGILRWNSKQEKFPKIK